MQYFTHNLFPHFERDREKYEFHPYAAWGMLLCSFALSLILVGLFGGVLFLRIENGSFWSDDATSTPLPKDTIDRARLTRVADLYAARQKELLLRKRSPLQIPDPSL